MEQINKPDTIDVLQEEIENYIEECIDSIGAKVKRIEVFNPEPALEFKLKYKKGTFMSDYHSFWKMLFKKNKEYTDDIFERVDYENNKVNIYRAHVLKWYIEHKDIYQAFIKYIWLNDRVYTNYAIKVLFYNKYGNTGQITMYYMAKEGKECAEEVKRKLEKKYCNNKYEESINNLS